MAPSTTATVLPTSLDQILIQIRGRLVGVLRWPEERVLPLDPEEIELPAPQGDQLVYFWPDDEPAAPHYFEGAGRVDARDDVKLGVEVCTRLAGDAKGSAAGWLVGQQYGHLAARHKVFDAQVGFVPQDAAQNMLTDAPLRPAGAGKPRRRPKTAGWGRSRLWFSFTYVLALNQLYG